MPYELDVQHGVNFVPVVVCLIVVTADAIDPHAASDLRRFQANRIDDFTDDERLASVEVLNKLKAQVAVFVVDLHFADIAFGYDVSLRGLLDSRDTDGLKFTRIKGQGHPTQELAVRSPGNEH